MSEHSEQYDTKLRSPAIDGLFEAMATLENIEEYYRFFEDLCTVNELQSMAQRFEVARMLRDGITYQTISQRTGASTATISRVNRCLIYGADGYRRVLDRLGERDAEDGGENR